MHLRLDRVLCKTSKNMSLILQFCVLPKAVKPWYDSFDGKKGPCPVHGGWRVGDPGLAHQLVGRPGRAGGEGSCVLMKGNRGDGRIGDGCSVDLLAASFKRYALSPWLYPVNLRFFRTDRRVLSASYGPQLTSALLLSIEMRTAWRSKVLAESFMFTILKREFSM
jgi:hypothetical protein